MAKSKLIGINKKIEKTVVDGYQKIETTIVDNFTKLEDRFVDNYLTHDGESILDAKERLQKEKEEREIKRKYHKQGGLKNEEK